MLSNGFVVVDEMRNRKSYDGATEKFGITVDNEDYIVKFSSSGLTSELYSEYVGSRFIRNLGIPCHETAIGYYGRRMVVLLKDFISDGCELRTFKHAMQSSDELELVYSNYTISTIVSLINSSVNMTDDVKKSIEDRFWAMLVCDAILGNDDRHWGNWGYLVSADGYRPATIYDNARSLYYDIGIGVQDYLRDKASFLESRTCRHPSPQLRSSHAKNKRLNYNTLFGDTKISECVSTLLADLSLHKVYMAITAACDYVPDPYKDFYTRLVCVRYLRILERLDMKEAYSQVCREVENGAS